MFAADEGLGEVDHDYDQEPHPFDDTDDEDRGSVNADEGFDYAPPAAAPAFRGGLLIVCERRTPNHLSYSVFPDEMTILQVVQTELSRDTPRLSFISIALGLLQDIRRKQCEPVPPQGVQAHVDSLLADFETFAKRLHCESFYRRLHCESLYR